MDAKSVLFALLRAAVCGEAVGDEVKAACTPEMLGAVYTLAAKHDLAHLAGHALGQLALSECETLKKFKGATTQAIFRYMKLDHALNQICNCLEDSQIPFIPLKGAVLRGIYPEPWMRTSCDIDVLVHEEDLERAVSELTHKGWEVKGKRNYHDISLFSPSGVHLELHFNIREDMESIDRVLDWVWEHSLPAEGRQYEHKQSNEYLLFHLLAHMSYHFLGGGCGIRPILDIWLLGRHITYDENVLHELCRAGELERFYDNVALLSRVWFEGCGHTPLTRRMEGMILGGAMYGSVSGSAAFKQVRSGGKAKHIIRRIFMPYEHLIIKYPLLKKYKWLTPVFQVVRWFGMLAGGRLKRSLQELKVNAKRGQDELQQAEAFMRELGLCSSEVQGKKNTLKENSAAK